MEADSSTVAGISREGETSVASLEPSASIPQEATTSNAASKTSNERIAGIDSPEVNTNPTTTPRRNDVISGQVPNAVARHRGAAIRIAPDAKPRAFSGWSPARLR